MSNRELLGDVTDYRAVDHKAWEEAGLDAIQDRHEMTYCNQQDDGFECLRGDWFIADDESRTIIFGTFGNYNSPGASHYTSAERFEEQADYEARLAEWEAYPEYLETEEEGD